MRLFGALPALSLDLLAADPGRLVELEFNGARMQVGPTKEARVMDGVYAPWDGHGGYQR